MNRLLRNRHLSFAVTAFLATPFLAPAFSAQSQGCIPTGTTTTRTSYETLPVEFTYELINERCEDGSIAPRTYEIRTVWERTCTVSAEQMIDPVTSQLCPPVTSVTYSDPFTTDFQRSLIWDPVPVFCSEECRVGHWVFAVWVWEFAWNHAVWTEPFVCPNGTPGIKQMTLFQRLGRHRLHTLTFYSDPNDCGGDTTTGETLGDWGPWEMLEDTTTVVTNCVGWPNVSPFNLSGEDGELTAELGADFETTESCDCLPSPAGLDFWLQLGRLGTLGVSGIPTYSSEELNRVVLGAIG